MHIIQYCLFPCLLKVTLHLPFCSYMSPTSISPSKSVPFLLIVQRLNDLAALVRGSLPELHRNIITALITIDVHARDIITDLIKEKVAPGRDPGRQDGQGNARMGIPSQ